MTQLFSIVRRPAYALLALTALACGLAFAIAPASAGVVPQPGQPNTLVKKLDRAGKPGDHITFTRMFVAKSGSLKVKVGQSQPGIILPGLSQIRVKVVDVATGATVLNQTITLPIGNPSHTFSWKVAESNPTAYRITVTNLSNSVKSLAMEVK